MWWIPAVGLLLSVENLFFGNLFCEFIPPSYWFLIFRIDTNLIYYRWRHIDCSNRFSDCVYLLMIKLFFGKSLILLSFFILIVLLIAIIHSFMVLKKINDWFNQFNGNNWRIEDIWKAKMLIRFIAVLVRLTRFS